MSKSKKSSENIPAVSQGEIINERYLIKKKLGAGSFGAVYLAQDLKLDVEKAIKIFGYNENTESMISELRKEARHQAKIRHPNIIHLNDFDASGKYLLLDMDYIEGVTLAEKLKKKIPQIDKYEYSLQIASALEAAHEKNIIHHDIKPSNIMINRQNTANLTDFGISEVTDYHNNKKSASGSRPYIAPEKIRGQRSSFRSDIFSYGVLLYELYYGKRPFKPDKKGIPDYKIPKNIIKSRRPLDKLIKECLNQYPDLRPQSFREITERLKKIKNEATKGKVKIIREYIEKKIRVRDMDFETKRDIALLFLLMILLVIAGPYYLKAMDTLLKSGKNTIIDFPSSAGFVNGEYKGVTPINARLEENDYFQAVNPVNGFKLDGLYQGGNYLRFRKEGNKIYLNNKLYGQMVNSGKDLPVDPEITFLYTDTDIPIQQLRSIKTSHPLISLGENFPAKSLYKLPMKTKFLRIANPDFHDLRKIFFLKDLIGLDISEKNKINLSYIKFFKKLQHLNIADSNKDNLDSIYELKELRSLNCSHNKLSSLAGIEKLTNLKSINLDDNFDLNSLQNLKNSDKLEFASLDKLPLISDEDKNILRHHLRNNRKKADEIGKKRIIPQGFIFQKIIVFLVFAVFILILIILIGLLGKMNFKNNQAKSNKRSEEEKTYKEEIEDIKKLIIANRLVKPEKHNALQKITDLLKKDPDNENLNQENKNILKKINEKIKTHQKRGETEPVYLLSNAARNIQPDPGLNSIALKSLKKLVSKSEENFVLIKGGSFEMGDFTEKGQNSAKPVHRVNLNDFYLSDTVVTNGQFCEFLNKFGNIKDQGVYAVNIGSPYCQIRYEKGKYFPKEPYHDFPVIEVSWFGAMRYCRWRDGRLPTEAEWEYAARNRGEKIIFSTGNKNSLKKSNFLIDKNDDRWHSSVAVKTYKPNKLGIYQMSGNVLEWCLDYFDPAFYGKGIIDNPYGPKSGMTRTVRGGGWCFHLDRTATFYRGSAQDTSRTNFIGFRVAKEA
ncbi:MAG: hypothetical protein CSB55_03710 [Candidatus Cloacimonadota bacterium]|nr:MAG: hypothetical protein CSB55_03710 [Candidatus Cloacimonadota bacterium]